MGVRAGVAAINAGRSRAMAVSWRKTCEAPPPSGVVLAPAGLAPVLLTGRIPRGAFHWHFELQPRTGQMAGLELGGDMYINSIPATLAETPDTSGVLRGSREWEP